jgi:uncharacterized membrane-anchored protein YitT (DUF2179 family)
MTKIAVLTGCAAVSALAINWMILPYRLNTGGVGGIAQIVYYLYGVSPWITTLVISGLALLIGARMMSLSFFIYSCIGSGLFSFFLGVTQNLPFPELPLYGSAIVAGLLLGICCGLVFYHQVTLGGMSTITFLLQKKFQIAAGHFDNALNLVILTTSALTVGLETLFPSVLCIVVSNLVLNAIMKRFVLL